MFFINLFCNFFISLSFFFVCFYFLFLLLPVNTMAQKFKKTTRYFHRYNSNNIIRLRHGWRKPHGIDNPMRRRFKGTAEMPRIGFGTDRAYRYRSNDGLYRVNVCNVKDIEMLTMQNRRMAAVINHNVSFRLRKQMIARAKQLAIKVVNKAVRVKSQEK